jgi:hypothetical protein
MAITSTPSNPHNNTSPTLLNNGNYADPFALATLINAQQGLPKDALDQVKSDCASLVKDSWLGFLDMFQMNFSFETDYIQFVESETPDYVIDDDGAVIRTTASNIFTIVPANIEGYVSGEDYFYFRVDDTISVTDNNGLQEIGVITTIDKANDTFTAVCRNGAAWSGLLVDITIDVIGGDHDKGSCGPESLLELRKTKSVNLKMITIKDAIQSSGGNRYAYTFPDGEVAWYDDNTLELTKRINRKIAKTLLIDIESVDGSGAHSAGKFGTKGLFQKLEQESLVNTGYITTVAHVEAITAYWNSLGFAGKEFIAHVDNTQYRHFEIIGGLLASQLNVDLKVVLGNTPDNFMKIGFNSITVDGYTIHFSKWGLVDGNSPLGKARIAATMPKGIIMPMGTVPTEINGVAKQVPYIFKAYQDKGKHGKPGMVRTYLTGGFNGDGDCEYAKISKSTTVGICCVCPEALTLIK